MEPFGQLMLAALGWILLVIGYVFTFGLLCVPGFRLYALWTAEDGVDHSPVLYLLSLVNALTWFSYGFLDPQSKAVLFINLVAIIAHLVYTIWYMCICSPRMKMVTAFFLAVVLMLFGVLAGIHALSPGSIGGGGRDALSVPVIITSALMYLSPLPDTVAAMYTGDAGRISIPIVVASLGNAFFWGEYGRVQGQKIVRESNEYGILSPFVQLVVYLILRRNELGQCREEIREFITDLTDAVLQTLRNGYMYLHRDEDENVDG